MRQGKRNGSGLKPVLNAADTGSVVNTVKGYAVTGRVNSGNYKAKNNMVSANASKRRK